MSYRFIRRHEQAHAVRRKCMLVRIYRGSYYPWKKRKPGQREQENEALIENIRRIHKLSRKTYSSPRVHAHLRKRRRACKKLMVRLMHQDGMQKRRKYHKMTTMDGKHDYPIAPQCAQYIRVRLLKGIDPVF